MSSSSGFWRFLFHQRNFPDRKQTLLEDFRNLDVVGPKWFLLKFPSFRGCLAFEGVLSGLLTFLIQEALKVGKKTSQILLFSASTVVGAFEELLVRLDFGTSAYTKGTSWAEWNFLLFPLRRTKERRTPPKIYLLNFFSNFLFD
ncbi:hypothetical protein J6590_066930 [Homalodisca vitripennis]|nr:hypothetical protein J6590_066930 [Homalodisca vitripennis]